MKTFRLNVLCGLKPRNAQSLWWSTAWSDIVWGCLWWHSWPTYLCPLSLESVRISHYMLHLLPRISPLWSLPLLRSTCCYYFCNLLQICQVVCLGQLNQHLTRWGAVVDRDCAFVLIILFLTHRSCLLKTNKTNETKQTQQQKPNQTKPKQNNNKNGVQ